MKLKILSLLLAVGALVSACGDDDNGSGPENAGRIRFVLLSPDAPDLDVLVDNVEVATNVPYLTEPEYLEFEAGTRNIQVRVSGSDEIVLDEDVTVVDGLDYSALLGNQFAAIDLAFLTDENTPASGSSAKVRLIHAAPSAGLVDIYVTAPGADLTQETPLFTAVDFGDFSPYGPVPAGEYQLRITSVGTTDVLIDSG
ncbi:MAG TPA: DUF4397 domain-containing protein, partial [Gemmatimonadales bacterium]|nr:DUF4397 domain-containing protein [Gemmatimonadales bacterium]